ncbi:MULTISPECIES: hypothetical protein [Cyanophyceae]|uniref:Bacteriocin n=1 Tax=Nodularia spumigena CENA596 TaxID=1819295 RepID=A0A166JPG0_NODSP|nr:MULTISPECIES: hypothetical protein [Cyanophyceae]MDB9357448.1 hypothetical protein [Nodularia spumigena CS-587/03]KZL49970.1 hypothetical protein A2T98_09940 [Nodularia spumigena CENA596]MDB9303540.1 hypothetical protein [Nodularia spumigena CS-591/12]MDB9317378.1 hypothetical protein [Nodularia spumigena CS-590/01A]MDB9323732.1 hypothetical protein [Nodularia spumigena CS-591/07A]
MANITLSELHAAGSELFNDSESFLNEFSDVDSISGGAAVAGTVATGATYVASNPLTLTKLAEAFVVVYAIEHVTIVAKSFSITGVY